MMDAVVVVVVVCEWSLFLSELASILLRPAYIVECKYLRARHSCASGILLLLGHHFARLAPSSRRNSLTQCRHDGGIPVVIKLISKSRKSR
jgi:hypothetical protein